MKSGVFLCFLPKKVTKTVLPLIPLTFAFCDARNHKFGHFFKNFGHFNLMSEQEYEALRSASVSARMEGFRVTEQTENDCILS